MKILVYSDDFPPITYTGASIVAYNLILGFQKKGHEIFVITTVQDKDKAGIEEYNGIKIFRIFSDYHIRWHAYLSIYNPQTIKKVKKITKEVNPDVCHFHNIHRYLSYHCFKIAKKNCNAVFLTAHDMMLFNYGKFIPKKGKCIHKVNFWNNLSNAKKRYNPLRNILIKLYLNNIDKIFSISNIQKQALMINGINNVETIYNGIDTGDWVCGSKQVKMFKNKYSLINRKIIFFGGRLSGAKGGDAILEVLKLVVLQIPEVILLVAGKNDYYSLKMQNLSKKYKLEKNILFAGWLDRDVMKTAFFSSDVCVTPSVYCDPFNLFNIEAAAAKKPVVGTVFGGTKEIVINDKTGYIVDPSNTGLFAEKIVSLLQNTERSNKFGYAGYERIKNNFSITKQVEHTLKWYFKFTK